jgi:membrane protein DedA with SNARE-associated domain
MVLLAFGCTLFLSWFYTFTFKVFTITSGLIGFNLFNFYFISLISRGLRFFIVSYLSYKFGDFYKFMKNMAQNGLQFWYFNLLYFLLYFYLLNLMLNLKKNLFKIIFYLVFLL